MKLSTKISLVTVVTLLLATGIFGVIVIYRTAQYSLNQTVDNYEQQVRATSYALAQEMSDNELLSYSDVTKKSFIDFLLRKYGSGKYMMVNDGKVICNLTDFELVDTNTDRWATQEVNTAIQKLGSASILIMGRNVDVEPVGSYQLVLISDISSLYGDIARQVLLFVVIYLAVGAMAALAISVMVRRTLRPLKHLQWAAAGISRGELNRRVKVRTKDELGMVGTAFNQMAEQVENQVRELEEVSERRKQLLGSLTHELKTPMTSIIGYSDTLLHVKISPEQQRNAVMHINSECKRLERLSGKLMSLIGLYDNDTVSMAYFPVQKLFNRVEALEGYHLKEKGMHLVMSCSIGELLMDVDLMESLLVNLIDNAMKASREGDTIDVIAVGNQIIVRDCGKGIPADEIPKITEAFYMVDKSRSKKAGGIGLGLALCKQIAALHGARLQIESQEGEGTSIHVIFEQNKERQDRMPYTPD